MRKLLFCIVFSVLFLTASSAKSIGDDGRLPRSTPMKEGVSSEWLIKYLDVLDTMDKDQQLHSIMILRHGKVIAEGWWEPYASDKTHQMWSVSKSFTATAVGFALNEGLIALDDKVISFFPDKLPVTVSENLRKLEIRHLLTMTAGQSREPRRTPEDTDWVKLFLGTPFDVEPGTVFKYNSMATYMLSAIVQKVTGQKLIDYLQPRLFGPLQITGIEWDESPTGENAGGWGLHLKTEDMAKFGQLFLDKGKWNGRQLLPAGWVEEASTPKITPKYTGNNPPQDIDWYVGYCYQMWRCRHNAYRADGAYGQFIVMIPEEDAVIVATAQSKEIYTELSQMWDYILPAFREKRDGLHDAAEMDGILKERLQNLTIKQ